MRSELFWQCGIFQHDIETALTALYISTWLRNCSDSVVFFYMTSELLGLCWIFLHVFLHDFWTVLTVRYFFTCFTTCLWNCCDSVVFFSMISELLWQWEQFRSQVKKYPTVRTVPKSCRKKNMLKNTTLSEQFRNHVEKYHTVRTVPKSCRKTCRKIQHCQSSSEIMEKNTTPSEQFQSNVEKHVKKYVCLLSKAWKYERGNQKL
jgi:hypothetical protein